MNTHRIGYKTDDVLRQTVAHILLAKSIHTASREKVLCWLCRRANIDGTVCVEAAAYRAELGMTPQHFHNQLRALRTAGLLAGSDGCYTLHDVPVHDPDQLTLQIDIERG